MLSLGTFAAFAFAIQSLSFELTEGSALPPSLIATISSLPIFVNTLALAASFLPFFCLIVLHLLCPDYILWSGFSAAWIYSPFYGRFDLFLVFFSCRVLGQDSKNLHVHENQYKMDEKFSIDFNNALTFLISKQEVAF